MEVDANKLDIQIPDLFRTTSKDLDLEHFQTIDKELEIDEDEEYPHTIIYIEEIEEEMQDIEASDAECDDLFDESSCVEGLEIEQGDLCSIGLDGEIHKINCDKHEKAGYQSNPTENNRIDLSSQGQDDCIILDITNAPENNIGDVSTHKVGSVSQKSPATVEEKTNLVNLGEKNCDDDCVLISDEEHDVPVNELTKKSPLFGTKRVEIKNLPDVTEKTIFEEFYFEDEDICIIDEHKLNGPKKTLVHQTTDGYRCPLYCTFLTKEQPLMINHLIKHKKSVVSNTDEVEATYECPMCPFMTFSHSTFVKHIFNHKKTNYSVVCSKCQFPAESLTSLKKHVALKHAAFLRCQNCAFKTRRKFSLRKHEERCKQPKKSQGIKCHFEPCPFTAASQENLNTHEWIQHQVGSNKIRNYKCTLDGCYFETFRKALFDEHVGLHSGEELRCKLCNYRTGEFNFFKEHILGHISVP